jgi:hypothetical protein
VPPRYPRSPVTTKMLGSTDRLWREAAVVS